MVRHLETLSGKDKSPEVVAEFVTDEGLKQQLAVFEAGFPRYWLKAEDMLIEGDNGRRPRDVWRYAHGDLMGIAPTGKEIHGEGISIYRIADDKIVEFRPGFDQLTVLQQLGVISPTGRG